MISLELNKIPEELYQCLVKNAELHQRSLNSEILDCLAIQMFQSNIKNRSNQVSIRNLLSAEELKALLSTEDDR
ncbi:Arc family DNA-binding protein [Acidithiobacillus sp. HP-6]|uniref:Arc family DNA-binding protein n=1 Tax=unclassified Acidithiobacillus TaxID=2614800 RepID=UPI0018798E00|nr:Arc family DNA-binding protein [Acidithiobacillus sp. HP-6]MBE7571076.1 Arc family DNA-binding protein [Acidithiobacillus sp. HP-2]